MSKKKKQIPPKSTEHSGNIIGIVISLAVSSGITLFLSVLMTYILLNSEQISDNYLMHFYFCVCLPSFAAGFIASKKCTFKGIISGLLSSVFYNLIITAAALCASGGEIRTDIIILYVLTTVFAVIGGIAAANTKRRRK